MPIIINATNEKVSVQIFGNWFNWTPGQEKTIRNEKVAKFIEMDRRGYGLAVLPDLLSQDELNGDSEVTDSELAARKEARTELKAQVCKAALDAYVLRLRGVIRNNEVSMQRDINRRGDKYDAAVEISDGELDAMRTVAGYMRDDKDAEQKRADEVKKLRAKISK